MNYVVGETVNPKAGTPCYSGHHSQHLYVFLPCLRTWADIQLVSWEVLALHLNPLIIIIIGVGFFFFCHFHGVQPLTFLGSCFQVGLFRELPGQPLEVLCFALYPAARAALNSCLPDA